MQVVLLDFEHGVNKEPDSDRRQDLEQINGNSHLSEQYLQLARDLDVMEAKTPEDVYKSHLVEGRAGDGPAIDSARQNLASTFVNAFVNAGFGQDKLVTATPESASEVRSQPSSGALWRGTEKPFFRELSSLKAPAFAWDEHKSKSLILWHKDCVNHYTLEASNIRTTESQ